MNKPRVDKINQQIKEFSDAIHKQREKQGAAERKIQSFGPDASEKLAEEKAKMENELNSGRGNFVHYDQLLTRIVDAEEMAKERAKAYAVWVSCRSAIKELEDRREKLRPELDAALRQQ